MSGAHSGKSLSISNGIRQLIIMDLEELANRYSMKDLRPLAKERSLNTGIFDILVAPI